MAVAAMVGSIVGVLIRLLMNRSDAQVNDVDHRHGSVVHGLAGAMVLGLLTGAALTHRDGTVSVGALSAGLSGALTTYCVFTSAMIAWFVRQPTPGVTALALAAEVLASLVAATCGVIVGIWGAGVLT